jgi:3,4-dihydroxy 2-butanone 4-phosphate synthase/GTP cyclohydrolase II
MTTATPENEIVLDSIESALEALRNGGIVIVVDDLDRENEGDLIAAAETATDEMLGFFIRYTSGVVCVPMTSERADSLSLPPMTHVNEDPKGTAYTVSCDAIVGTHTGISAADRALTARLLASPEAAPTDLSRPGHMFPLRGVAGGVLARRGHTEASIDLARLSGHEPVAIISELNHDDGTMMRLPALRVFADEHGLPLVSIEDLVQYREEHEKTERQTVNHNDVPTLCPIVDQTDPVTIPTPLGSFQTRGWRQEDGTEHMTVTVERTPEMDNSGLPEAPLVRVHSECLTGDVFHSYRCDCGDQLAKSLEMIQEHGGTVVYVRGHEGRGIGLFEKLRAYALQEHGRDTVDANLELGFPADARDYANTAAILHAMGLDDVTLITNNPAKKEELERHGIRVSGTVPCVIPPRPENKFYMDTKAQRMRHSLPSA